MTPYDPLTPCPIALGDTCESCPLGHKGPSARPIAGYGPVSRVIFVGGGPGFYELQEGIPWVGPTGVELSQLYLPLTGFSRGTAYTTNASKCFHPNEKKLPGERVRVCAELHLRRELHAIQPELVVLMGGDAAKLLGDDFNIELEHGRLWRGVDLLGWTCDVVTTLHPALGLRSTGSMQEILDDFEIWVNRAIEGVDLWPKDEIAGRYIFEEATVDNDIAFSPPSDGFPVTVDTELSGLNQFTDSIYCLSYSTADDNGYLIRAGDTEALKRFQRLVEAHTAYHKAAFDGPVATRLGLLDFYGCTGFTDTMILAYNLCMYGVNQSLKTLGRRLLGVRMREFEEVVRPYANTALMEYLTRAQYCIYPKPEGRKHSGDKRIKAFLKACTTPSKRSPVPADPLTKWSGWDAEIKGLIEATMGEYAPKVDVFLVPFGEVLQYACLDANVGRRVLKVLQGRVDNWTPPRPLRPEDVDLYC